MGKFIDLTGKKFGRWLVLSKFCWLEEKDKYRYLYNCKCDCGTERLVSTDSLKRGRSKSCGCLSKEMASRDNGPDLDAKYVRTSRFTGIYK